MNAPPHLDHVPECPSHAFVVLKPETQLSAVDVTNFVAGRVAAYKHVRNVTFVEEIPKSASGKILRRVLRDRLKEGSTQQ